MPSQALCAPSMRLRPFSRAYRSASSVRGPNSVRSISSEAGARRLPFGTCSYGFPFHSTVGITGITRFGATAAVATASATLVTILKPDQRPEAREQARACRPRSSTCCTFPGKNTGIWRLARRDSEALGIVDDLQPGSSPTMASPPPVRETPTKLPCRSESAARSSPGALPYHMASTPSYFAPGSCEASWLPHADVAPSSSLRPGSWRTWCCSTSSRLRASSWSRPPSGEPWYPEIMVPVCRPRRLSARCWSSGRRPSPWRPVSRMRPSSRTYLSSSETSRSEPRLEPPLAPERTKRCPWEGLLLAPAPRRTAIDIRLLLPLMADWLIQLTIGDTRNAICCLRTHPVDAVYARV